MKEKNVEFISLDRIRRQLIVGRLVGAAIILVALMAVAWVVHAAPVQSAEECNLLGDMVVVAHAMQRKGHSDEAIRVVLDETHMAFVESGHHERWASYVGKVLAFSRRPEITAMSPKAVGVTFAQVCGQLQGDVDTIFGASS